MTELKKSFKGMAAALSMATLSLLGVGCNNDTKLPGEKAFDDYVKRVESNPKQSFSAEIDDNNIGARSVEFNQIFAQSDFILDIVQKDKKRGIRAAVKEALAIARQQKKLPSGIFEKEFLQNYTPSDNNAMTRQEWIAFFKNSALTSDSIRAEGTDKSGVIPKTLTGDVFRLDGNGFWRVVSPLSASAGTRSNIQHRYTKDQYTRLVQRYEKLGR